MDLIGLLRYLLNLPFSNFGVNLLYPLALLLLIPLIFFIVWLIRKSLSEFTSEEELANYNHEKKKIRRKVIITRIIVIILLVLALASPFSTKTKSEKGDLTLTLLVDKSSSFELFNDNIAEELKEKLQRDIPVEIRYLAYGNDSSIGDALMNNIQGNDNIMIITDGNSNKGKSIADMMLFASSLNTTVSALQIEPEKSDIAVSVDGPSESIYGNEMTFYVDVTNVDEDIPYHINVKINDGEMLNKDSSGTQTFEFKQRLIPGYHKIVATVTTDDHFEENNVYYKTIHVLEQPHVLLVGGEGTYFEDLLDKVYAVSRKKVIPDDLSIYNTVILDDVSVSEFEDNIQGLTDYVDDGNGLIVIGGKHSYDRGGYQNSIVETLLPVRVGVSKLEEGDEMNIVILIDISGTFSYETYTGSGYAKISVTKAQALELLKKIKPEHYVNILLFDSSVHYYDDENKKMIPLGEQKEIEEKLRNVKGTATGGTFIPGALRESRLLLDGLRGSKHVVLITDGINGVEWQAKQAISDANLMRMKGIKVHTIGVGADTNIKFMKELSEIGGGSYFQADETKKLSLLFGGDIEQTDENKVILMDNAHFITNGLPLSATLTGYNQVIPKNSAKLLAMTAGGYPILSVWRFGLGRVVSLSTDDGCGWSGELLNKDNSRILTRTINWAIGNPEKNKDFEVQVKDSYADSPAEIIVFSKDGIPEHEKLSFSKIDENTYHSYFSAEEPGFYDFFDATVAINYDSEYKNLGYNKDVSSLVTTTGGEMFTMDDTEKIVEFVKKTSKRTKQDTTYYRWPFILLAVIVFLAELFIRRMESNKNQ